MLLFAELSIEIVLPTCYNI